MRLRRGRAVAVSPPQDGLALAIELATVAFLSRLQALTIVVSMARGGVAISVLEVPTLRGGGSTVGEQRVRVLGRLNCIACRWRQGGEHKAVGER